MDPVKAMAIATMKLPTTVKELKSFLGRSHTSGDSSLGINYFCFRQTTQKRAKLCVWRNITNGFQKAITYYDEPPYCASPNS